MRPFAFAVASGLILLSASPALPRLPLPNSSKTSGQTSSQDQSPSESPQALPSYRFSREESSESIPIEVVADGLVLVNATIDGHAGWFIVDNGTQGFVVDRTFGHQASLQVGGNALTREVGSDSRQAGIVRDIEIGLPGLTLTHRNLLVLDLKNLEPAIGHEVDGIIGSRLFDDFVVRVDYERQRISIYSPNQFHASDGETAFPVRVDSHGFQYIDATFTLPGALPVSGSFLIDGGANYYANIYKPFCDSHHLPPAGMKLLSEPGVGPRDGKADRMDVGKYSIRNPVITFAQDVEGLMAAKDYAGLIGAEFLERFLVTFDSGRKRVLLKPNRSYGTAAEYDQSGIHVRAEGQGFHRFVVARIVADSAAVDAGLRAGDVVTSVDKRGASVLTLSELRRLFRQPKASYRIGLLRGHKALSVVIRLRPLL